MNDDYVLAEDTVQSIIEGRRGGLERRLARSHELLRAERDLYRSIAERYADLWQPQFSLNPDEGLWVFPWDDDVEPVAMTREQVAWIRARREART